ncbi:MAG: hypothetical protein R3C56_29080 [Pirellulaceae bacterium]
MAGQTTSKSGRDSSIQCFQSDKHLSESPKSDCAASMRGDHIAQADHFTVRMFGGHPQIVLLHMLKRYSRHTKALIQLSFSCLK